MAASPDLLKYLPKMSPPELAVVQRQCIKDNDYESMAALMAEMTRRQTKKDTPWRK